MPSEKDIPVSIAEQAAQWWVTLNGEDTSASTRREFGAWASQAPEFIAAYLRMALLMKAAKTHQIRWPGTPGEVLIREAKSSSGHAVVHELPRRSPPPSYLPERKYQRRTFVVAFATVLLAALGVAWFVSASPEEFHTSFGERRSIALTDGSRIGLNTESKVRVEFNSKRRLVTLDTGEALFQVAHDSRRPFEVRVGKVVLRAVGTEFNVDRRASSTTVTIVEGRVLASPDWPAFQHPSQGSSQAPQPLLLGAADQIVISQSGWSEPQHGVNPRATVAWTENKVIFEHTPLSEVAEEFNRYNRQHIRIEGAQLRRQQVSGVFQCDDPTSFLSFLANEPGVRIHDGPDNTRIVERN
jgi:transmembrane sensor